MFNFIRRLFYKPPQRIFNYFDGSRWCSCDPYIIEMTLVDNVGLDWRDQYASLSQPMPLGVGGVLEEEQQKSRIELRDKILLSLRESTGIENYVGRGMVVDGKRVKRERGLTVAAQLGILNLYLKFCLDLMRLARPFVTSQSREPPTPVNSPTPNPVVSSTQESGSKQQEPSKLQQQFG